MPQRKYQQSHPWLDFALDIRQFPFDFWRDIGECLSKCDHLRRTAMSAELRKQLLQVYITKGAAATTAIEGNTLSEEQVEYVVCGRLSQLPPLSHGYQPMVTQVDNVITLFNDIYSKAEKAPLQRLTPALLCDFQRQVLKNLTVDGNIGAVRQRGVVVNGYRGAPPEECDYLLTQLCSWLYNAACFKELQDKFGRKAAGIFRAALAHLYIAWIHPFDDGNGRTARMAEFYLLVAAGLPGYAAHLPASHCNKLREEYYRQLAEASAQKSPFAFVHFIARGLRDGLREQLEYVYKEHERLVWQEVTERKITGSESARRRRVKVARLLLEKPPATVKALMQDANIAVLYKSRASDIALLANDLKQLEQAEIVARQGNDYNANTRLIRDLKTPDSE